MQYFPQKAEQISASNHAVKNNFLFARAAKLAMILMALSMLAALQIACGSHSLDPPPGQTPIAPGQPTFSHVFLIIEENHSYSEVIGNSSMPYLNSLASQYGLATRYFANAHPSIPNYLLLTTGLTETFDDTYTGAINDDNVVRELVKAGKSWKAYEESLPKPGFISGDDGPYVRRHNPFAYLSDVQNDSSQAANIVPFSQFTTDLANDSLPQFSFITPNVNNDAHDASLAAADSWLKANIVPLLASSAFKSSGLLIITFDEGMNGDIDHGGGHVATVIVSSKSKSNYKSETEYQHQSTLRLVLAASGVDSFPGLAAAAPDMTEFFNGQ